MLSHYIKNLNNAAPYTPLDETKQNFDHEMISLDFIIPAF